MTPTIQTVGIYKYDRQIWQKCRASLFARFGHLSNKELRQRFRDLADANGWIVSNMIGDVVTQEKQSNNLAILRTDPDYVRNAEEMNDIERFDKYRHSPDDA